jgi:hypothetical protein
VLLLLGWFGVVLWRYREVDPPHALGVLLAAGLFLGLFTLAAYGPGAVIWRLITGQLPRDAPSIVIALATGAGALIAAAACLSLMDVLLPPSVTLVGLTAVLVGAATIVASRRAGAGPPRETGRSGWRVELIAPALIVALAALVSLAALPTLSPFYDQFNYHLAFPFHWLRAGHIVVHPRHSYSFLPANMGLLFTYALATVGAWAGQAVHWWMGALATLAAAVLARRLAGPRAGAWGAALFAATPSVIMMSSWAAADLATAAFGLAGWLMIVSDAPRSHGREPSAWWVLAGAFAGLASGCKILALATVALPLFLGLVLSVPGWPRGGRWRRVALWGAGATLALAPWLVRNLTLTGNPLYPFLNRVIPPRVLIASEGRDTVEAAGMVARFPAHRLSQAERLTLGTFNPQGFAGSIGPVFVALAPLALWAALGWRRRRAPTLLAGAVLSIAGWWIAPQLGRYLAPALGLLAVLCAVGWSRVVATMPRVVSGWLTVLLAGVLVWNVQTAFAGTLDRIACTFGWRSEENLLREQVSYWSVITFVNNELPSHARLLLVAESRSLFLDRDLVVEDPYVTPFLVSLAEAMPSAEAMAAELRRLGVTHVLLNHHEAARIAALNRRADYFAPLSPPARARLEQFLSRCLEPVARADAVEVLAVGSCAS